MSHESQVQELLTISEAAKFINVHPNTLRNWERDGRIQAVRIGARRDRRYPKQVIQEMCQVSMD